MISDFELARRLFPKARVIVERSGITQSRTTQVRGWATADSEDGSVTVVLDTDAAGTDAEITVPTTGGITEGSEVRVTLVDGAPVGCSQSGSIDVAQAIASAAQSVADAINQHFWTDSNGAHVTQVPQDEWDNPEGASYHSGPNSLWNSLGVLFRDGLTNLLAVLTNGIAIYDGQGNAASNILAEFTANLVRIGGRFATSGQSSAGVQFFADDSSTSDLTASHYIDTTQDMQVYHNLMLDGTTTDAMLTGGTATHSASGNLATYQEVYNDGTNWSEESDTGILAKTGNAQQVAKMGVNTLRSSAGTQTRRAYVQADTLRLTHGYGSSAEVLDLAMPHVIDVLSGPSTVEVSTSSGVSVADSTNKSLVTLNLNTPGLWLLIGHVVFPSNGTGLRASAIASSKDAGFSASATNSTVNLRATSGGVTAYSLIHLLTFSSGTLTRYLNVYQTSGSSLSVEGSIKAIRLGPA